MLLEQSLVCLMYLMVNMIQNSFLLKIVHFICHELLYDCIDIFIEFFIHCFDSIYIDTYFLLIRTFIQKSTLLGYSQTLYPFLLYIILITILHIRSIFELFQLFYIKFSLFLIYNLYSIINFFLIEFINPSL